jgi:hypothetical protein
VSIIAVSNSCSLSPVFVSRNTALSIPNGSLAGLALLGRFVVRSETYRTSHYFHMSLQLDPFVYESRCLGEMGVVNLNLRPAFFDCAASSQNPFNKWHHLQNTTMMEQQRRPLQPMMETQAPLSFNANRAVRNHNRSCATVVYTLKHLTPFP